MTILAATMTVVALIATAYAVRFYIELRRWAERYKGARIAISYKRKVKLDRPLSEWYAWCRMLDEDKLTNGRVVYSMGGTSVAVIKPPPVTRNKRDSKAPAKPPAREGKWSAQDETKKVGNA